MPGNVIPVCRTVVTLLVILLLEDQNAYDINDTLLTACSIIESGNRKFMIDYGRIAAALDIAVKHANEMVLPSGITLIRRHKNSSEVCTAKSPAVARVMEWLQEGVVCDVYIGPGCTDGTLDVYKMAEFLHKPIITCPASGMASRTGLPRSAFPNLIRTGYTSGTLGKATASFLDLYNYTHSSIIIHRDDPFYSELGDNLRDYLRGSRVELYNKANLVYVSDDKDANGTATLSDSLLTSTLQDANASSRVNIIFANAAVLRRILLMASRLGMVNGQYIYLAFDLFPSETWGRFVWENGDSRDSEVHTAYKSLIILSITRTSDHGYNYAEDFAESVRHLALTKYGYRYGAINQVDPIVMGFYEAVVLYATGIRRLYDMGANLSDTSALLSVLRNISVLTPLRTFVNLTAAGDKNVVYDLKIFDDEQGAHRPFLRVDALSGEVLRTSAAKWSATKDNSFPPDTPRCGYSGLECTEDSNTTTIIVACVAVLVVLGAIAGAVLYYVRSHKIGAVPAFWWRYRLTELEFPHHRGASASRLTMNASNSKMTRVSAFFTACPWKTANLHGSTIGVKPVEENTYRPSNEVISQMNEVQPLRHINLQRFIGMCLDDTNYIVYVLAEHCQKGCLDDLLEQKSLVLDWSFKYSLINDVAEGMHHLHSTSVQSHGFMTSLACLVDSRLSIKLSDYGVTKIRDSNDFAPLTKEYKSRDYNILLWRAPELLRTTMPDHGSQKGDVYSFAIILQQIILRCGPFESPGNTTQMSDSPMELLLEICNNTTTPIRPPVPRSACSSDLLALMEVCWSEFPVHRPSFQKIKDSVKKIGGLTGGNLVDHLIKRMEKYALDLEDQVTFKTQQFMDEKLRCEELLSQMLPKAIAQSLVRGDSVLPEFFQMITAYFSDVVGFTNIAASGTAMDVISLLNDLYTRFDHVVEKHDAYKVETIGDAYMVASGLPVRNGDLHAKEVGLVARDILLEVTATVIPQRPSNALKIRSGMHSGSCVAGIIGIKAPRYCLFGDSINTASRMESTGEAMKIQTTQATKELLGHFSEFTLTLRGQVEVKGKGLMTTYWLT